MTALALLEESHHLGLRLSVRGDKLHVEPTPSPQFIEKLRAAKPDLLRMLTLESAAAEACVSLKGYITPADLLARLAPEDVTDLEAVPTDSAVRFLHAIAAACAWTDMRRQGIAPPNWDKPARCDRCGPVYLWASVRVAGCPWCWNRLHGIKIPRPPPSISDA